MVDRLSSTQIFNILTSQILNNQNKVVDLSNKLNLGKEVINSYDVPFAISKSLKTQGEIKSNEQVLKNQRLSIIELELADTSISGIKDILDKIKELSITGGNDTLGASERNTIAQEVRVLGESIVQLANSKSGSKYIFSGKQSNIATINLPSGANFSTATYKSGLPDLGEREVNGVEVSINLNDALITQARGATSSSNIINPTVATNGNLDFEINDGNGNTTNFTANLTAGMDLATTIATINASFNGAGGLGSIAEEAPAGYLKLNTELITGNSQNKTASIKINNSSNNTTINEIGLKIGFTRGIDSGVMHTLDALESALIANDSAGVRDLLDNLDSNIKTIIDKQTETGALVNKLESLEDNATSLDIKLKSDLSNVEDLDFIQATSDLASLQSALETSIQTTAGMFRGNIFNFLGG